MLAFVSFGAFNQLTVDIGNLISNDAVSCANTHKEVAVTYP
jgi:hypothetical protein